MSTIFDRIADEYPVREVLKRAGVKFKGHDYFFCPCHPGSVEPSGSISRGEDGRERWKCFSCGQYGDGLDFVQVFQSCDRSDAVHRLTGKTLFEWNRMNPDPSRRKAAKPGPPDYTPLPFPVDLDAKFSVQRRTPEILMKSGQRQAYTPSYVFRYQNPHGETLLIMLRMTKSDGEKMVFPVRFSAEHGLIARGWLRDEVVPFFRENELNRRQGDPVLVVEGEKCAFVVAELPAFADYVPITWHGGSAVAKRSKRWELLRGRKVVFWPDADKVKALDLERDPTRLGASEAGMMAIADKIGGDQLHMVCLDETWFDKAKGYDVVDLVEEVGADQARTEMESRILPYRPREKEREPPKPPPEEPPRQDSEGNPLPYSRNGDPRTGPLCQREWGNWVLYVTRDPAFGHVVTYDVITKDVLVDGVPLARPKEIIDGAPRVYVSEMQIEMANPGPWRAIKPRQMGELLEDAGMRNPVNRVLDAIRSVPWDGHRRELADYVGASRPDRWSYVACHRWLLGLVRRIREPGCKHDGVLVLEGKTGRMKTGVFETLGAMHGFDLYTDLPKLVQEKDIQMKIAPKVVVELGEMTAQRQGESDSLKGMITERHDFYRPPYGAVPIQVPRNCVFGGTTNETQYLKDPNGNRRYWIVAVDMNASLDDLRRDLPQLLAQALHDLESGVQNWLTPEEEELQKGVATEREIDDPMYDGLDELLTTRSEMYLSRAQIWDMLEIKRDRRPANDRSKALTRAMEKLGWELGRWHRQTTDKRTFKRPPERPVARDDDDDIPL